RFQVPAQPGRALADPGQHVSQTSLHVDARALGERSGAAFASAETDRSRQLFRERLDLLLGAAGPGLITERFRLSQGLFQIFEATLVLAPRFGINHRPGVSELRGAGAEAIKLRDMDLAVRMANQLVEVAEALAVAEAHLDRAMAEQPGLAVSQERQRRG